MARSTSEPEDLAALFAEPASTIAQIAVKTKQINAFSAILAKVCPDIPAKAIRIANIKADTIVIEVNSPVWGQRLQFEKNTLLAQFHANGFNHLTRIEILVRPFQQRSEQKQQAVSHKGKHPMPADVAQQLTELAADLPDSLKNSLLRLAKHAQKKSHTN